jgi:agmatine deiminase
LLINLTAVFLIYREKCRIKTRNCNGVSLYIAWQFIETTYTIYFNDTGKAENKMKDLPSTLGYKMPAEWERQNATWFSWIHNNSHWNENPIEMKKTLAEIIATISQFQKVFVNAADSVQEELNHFLKNQFLYVENNVCLFNHETNDLWCRDHGPIYVRNAEGCLALVNWGFNAWGEKFPPWDLDNQIPNKIATLQGCKKFDAPMILEGGSIEVNGVGDLITTESVLLNPNRNPQLSRSEIEKHLRDYLGVKRIFWLKRGIAGDDTDGHIDDLVRFVDERTLVVASEADPNDVNFDALNELYSDLLSILELHNLDWTVHKLPMPKACNAKNWRLDRLPASYTNFLIINEAVIVPVFDQLESDAYALSLLGKLFPKREIVPIDCRVSVFEGGAIHCLSQQQPYGHF